MDCYCKNIYKRESKIKCELCEKEYHKKCYTGKIIEESHNYPFFCILCQIQNKNPKIKILKSFNVPLILEIKNEKREIVMNLEKGVFFLKKENENKKCLLVNINFHLYETLDISKIFENLSIKLNEEKIEISEDLFFGLNLNKSKNKLEIEINKIELNKLLLNQIWDFERLRLIFFFFEYEDYRKEDIFDNLIKVFLNKRFLNSLKKLQKTNNFFIDKIKKEEQIFNLINDKVIFPIYVVKCNHNVSIVLCLKKIIDNDFFCYLCNKKVFWFDFIFEKNSFIMLSKFYSKIFEKIKKKKNLEDNKESLQGKTNTQIPNYKNNLDISKEKKDKSSCPECNNELLQGKTYTPNMNCQHNLDNNYKHNINTFNIQRGSKNIDNINNQKNIIESPVRHNRNIINNPHIMNNLNYENNPNRSNNLNYENNPNKRNNLNYENNPNKHNNLNYENSPNRSKNLNYENNPNKRNNLNYENNPNKHNNLNYENSPNRSNNLNSQNSPNRSKNLNFENNPNKHNNFNYENNINRRNHSNYDNNPNRNKNSNNDNNPNRRNNLNYENNPNKNNNSNYDNNLNRRNNFNYENNQNRNNNSNYDNNPNRRNNFNYENTPNRNNNSNYDKNPNRSNNKGNNKNNYKGNRNMKNKNHNNYWSKRNQNTKILKNKNSLDEDPENYNAFNEFHEEIKSLKSSQNLNNNYTKNFISERNIDLDPIKTKTSVNHEMTNNIKENKKKEKDDLEKITTHPLLKNCIISFERSKSEIKISSSKVSENIINKSDEKQGDIKLILKKKNFLNKFKKRKKIREIEDMFKNNKKDEFINKISAKQEILFKKIQNVQFDKFKLEINISSFFLPLREYLLDFEKKILEPSKFKEFEDFLDHFFVTSVYYYKNLQNKNSLIWIRKTLCFLMKELQSENLQDFCQHYVYSFYGLFLYYFHTSNSDKVFFFTAYLEILMGSLIFFLANNKFNISIDDLLTNDEDSYFLPHSDHENFFMSVFQAFIFFYRFHNRLIDRGLLEMYAYELFQNVFFKFSFYDKNFIQKKFSQMKSANKLF